MHRQKWKELYQHILVGGMLIGHLVYFFRVLLIFQMIYNEYILLLQSEEKSFKNIDHIVTNHPFILCFYFL